jgi:hypothetical protein
VVHVVLGVSRAAVHGCSFRHLTQKLHSCMANFTTADPQQWPSVLLIAAGWEDANVAFMASGGYKGIGAQVSNVKVRSAKD